MLKNKLFALLTCCFAFVSSAIFAEQTLALLKPDSVQNNNIGKMIARYEEKGLKISGLRMVKLSKEQAGEFYAIHKDRPFYGDLVEFISSGPLVAIVLEGDNAVARNREIMGATDPKKAAPGTLRADFASSMSRNAVHGSDSVENANKEIPFFFKSNEIFSR